LPKPFQESAHDTPARPKWHLTCDKTRSSTSKRQTNCRKVQHPSYVDQAVKACVSWSQIAEAVGSSEAQARQQYQEWAESQHRLHVCYDGKFGINDAEYAAAIKRASEPPAAPGAEREAGQ